MTLEQAVKYYGSMYRIAKELGLSTGTPLNWKKIGYIPAIMQVRIERQTKGKLKLGLEDVGQ